MAKRRRDASGKFLPAVRTAPARATAQARLMSMRDSRPPLIGTTDDLLRVLRGTYDSARTVYDNRKHWANSDSLSADAANSSGVLTTLRNRSRYEFANNSYCKGIIHTLAYDCIGTGPRLQMLTQDEGNNRMIEAVWREWSATVDLPEKLRLARVTRAHSGEAFLLPFTNTSLDSLIKLDVRLYEPDQVGTPDGVVPDKNTTDGIKYDANGVPELYFLLSSHPGAENTGLTSQKATGIPADQMIHWYKADRPGQHRGVPEITSALPLFAILRRFTLATIEAAEFAASMAGFAHTDYLPNDAAAEVDDLSLEFARNTMTFLPEGWKVDQMKAEHPNEQFRMVRAGILSEIARCLFMPYNIAALDSSESNFSSGQLDQKTYYQTQRVERSRAESIVVDPIFDDFMDEAEIVLDLPRGLAPRERQHRWFWDRLGQHNDPAKVARGRDLDLRNESTNLAIVYAEDGRDVDTELERADRVGRKQIEQQVALVKFRRETMEREGVTDEEMDRVTNTSNTETDDVSAAIAEAVENAQPATV